MASMADRTQSSTESHHGRKTSSAFGRFNTCCWSPLVHMVRSLNHAVGPSPPHQQRDRQQEEQEEQSQALIHRLAQWSPLSLAPPPDCDSSNNRRCNAWIVWRGGWTELYSHHEYEVCGLEILPCLSSQRGRVSFPARNSNGQCWPLFSKVSNLPLELLIYRKLLHERSPIL